MATTPLFGITIGWMKPFYRTFFLNYTLWPHTISPLWTIFGMNNVDGHGPSPVEGTSKMTNSNNGWLSRTFLMEFGWPPEEKWIWNLDKNGLFSTKSLANDLGQWGLHQTPLLWTWCCMDEFLPKKVKFFPKEISYNAININDKIQRCFLHMALFTLLPPLPCCLWDPDHLFIQCLFAKCFGKEITLSFGWFTPLPNDVSSLLTRTLTDNPFGSHKMILWSHMSLAFLETISSSMII